MVNALPRNYDSIDDTKPLQDAWTTYVSTPILGNAHWFDAGFNPHVGLGGGVDEEQLKKQNPSLARSHARIYDPDGLYKSNMRKDEIAMQKYEEREMEIAGATAQEFAELQEANRRKREPVLIRTRVIENGP